MRRMKDVIGYSNKQMGIRYGIKRWAPLYRSEYLITSETDTFTVIVLLLGDLYLRELRNNNA